MNQFYGTPYGYQQPNMVTMQNRKPGSIIWVHGDEGARSYYVAPNDSVILLDADIEGKMYIKTADNIGMCTLRYFNFNEIIDVHPNQMTNSVQYATKQDVQELRDLIDSLWKGGQNESVVQATQYGVSKTYGSGN